MSEESLTLESTTQNGQTLVSVMLLIPPLGNWGGQIDCY